MAALVVCLGGALWPASARAQDTTAEAVFEEGVKLFEAGDFAAACPRLKGAVKLSSGEALGGRLLLAECYEKVGKWASAWALYREIVPKAAASGQPARRDRAEAGRARVEPRLPRLSLLLAPEVATLPGLAIESDGALIPREAWDIALPVDPGTVVITARADGKRARVFEVKVADAPTTTTARIDRLEEQPGAPAAGQPPLLPATGKTTDGGTGDDDGGLSGTGIAGLILGGAGLAGMGVSVLVAAGAQSSWSDAVDARDTQGVDDARGTGNLATGIFVASAVVTAVGATLLVVDLTGSSSSGGESASRSTASRRHLVVYTQGLGAAATGAF